jgi:hypothetical protein
LADVLLYGVKIFSERGQRNFGPTPALDNQRASVRHSRHIRT